MPPEAQPLEGTSRSHLDADEGTAPPAAGTSDLPAHRSFRARHVQETRPSVSACVNMDASTLPRSRYPYQLHLDTRVDDMEAAEGAVLPLGARRLPAEREEGFRKSPRSVIRVPGKFGKDLARANRLTKRQSETDAHAYRKEVRHCWSKGQNRTFCAQCMALKRDRHPYRVGDLACGRPPCLVRPT
jgi:hypothetical protein